MKRHAVFHAHRLLRADKIALDATQDTVLGCHLTIHPVRKQWKKRRGPI